MAIHTVKIVTVTASPTAVSRGVAKSWEEFASRWKPMLDGVWAFLRQSDLRGIVPSNLPHGRAAHTVHVGDYASLGEAHDAIARWCRTTGHTPSGTRWEVYGDWDADAANLQTAVYWLLDS
jgi:hypothetical protein